MEVVEVFEAVDGAKEDTSEEVKEEAQEDRNTGGDSYEVKDEGKSNNAYTTRYRRPRHVFRTRNTFNRNLEIIIQ